MGACRDPFDKVRLGSGRAMHGGETLRSSPEFLRELVLQVSLGESHGGEEGIVDGRENEHHCWRIGCTAQSIRK